MLNVKSKKSGMTRVEFLVNVGILLVIFTLAFFNFRQAQVLARDVQRKNDLKHIAAALNFYLKDYVAYPGSDAGKIVACGSSESPNSCMWGRDGIADIIDPLPIDPLGPGRGYDYLYVSDGRNFQIFAHLEREQDDERNDEIIARGLPCGEKICNFGVANGGVRLDIGLGEQ